MTGNVDLYWSFRSPYSYLATKRLRKLPEDFDIVINVRPVYPIAVRMPDFFDTVNPMWPPYLLKDTIRIAEMEGLAYRWPNPDPIVQDFATRTIAKEQPYIHRLTRLGILAAESGDGMAFLDEISSVIWTGVENWHEGDHLKLAAARAGFDLDEMDAKVEADPDHFAAAIEANEAAQHEAGHWGVPLMVFEGEPFFGQDRISHLTFRLEKAGLKR